VVVEDYSNPFYSVESLHKHETQSECIDEDLALRVEKMRGTYMDCWKDKSDPDIGYL
jgi:hypothetical protein